MLHMSYFISKSEDNSFRIIIFRKLSFENTFISDFKVARRFTEEGIRFTSQELP